MATVTAGTSYTDLGAGAPGTLNNAGTLLASQTTPTPLAWNASAGDIQSALENLSHVGKGNVVVQQNDDVYTIRFQGSLSDAPIHPLTTSPSLVKTTDALGGATQQTVAGTAVVTVRTTGSSASEVNQEQLLSVSATSGTYTLTFHDVNGTPYTTDAIPYNASAEELRQAIQNAIAVGEAPGDPNTQAYLVDKLDVIVDRYPGGYLNQDIYVLSFQGQLRHINFGTGIDTVTADTSSLTGSATFTTRMDGIDYYGFEQVNVDTGSGSDVFNVQGTTQGSNGFNLLGGVAQTNVNLHNGDSHVYLSSDANVDQCSWNGPIASASQCGGPTALSAFDFLTGNLDDFRGALNLNLGTGRDRLFISDEAESNPDMWAITRSLSDPANYNTSKLATGADIYLTRMGKPGISYVTTRQPLRRRELLDGLRRRHRLHRRDEARRHRGRRSADDDDPRHRPRRRQRSR